MERRGEGEARGGGDRKRSWQAQEGSRMRYLNGNDSPATNYPHLHRVEEDLGWVPKPRTGLIDVNMVADDVDPVVDGRVEHVLKDQGLRVRQFKAVLG